MRERWEETSIYSRNHVIYTNHLHMYSYQGIKYALVLTNIY